ncbi:MAG: hypothetical protein AB7G11_00505 [Phycisphaerales bacterium]
MGTTHRIGLAFCVFVVCGEASALGGVLARQPDPESKPVTILAFEHAGLGSMLVDKKDQKLKEALEMLPTRIKELPGEFPKMRDVPMPAIELLTSVLTSPGRVALTFDPAGQEKGAMGFGLIASIASKDRSAAQAMHGRVSGLMRRGGDGPDVQPSKQFRGMSEIEAPFGGVIRYGPRQSGESWHYEVHAGALGDPEQALSPLKSLSVPAAAGFAPNISARMDFAALNHVVEAFAPLIEDAGPEAQTVLKEIENMGLLGEHAIKMTMRSGFTQDAAVSYAVIEGLRPHAQALGLSTTPLSASHMAMIPADATVAYVASFDMKTSVQALRDLIASDPEAAGGLEQFEGATGVNLVDDVLLSLGGVSGFYMSDSTGGSIASAVIFIALSDRPKFEDAHSKLVGFANSTLASHQEIKGHIRIRAWDDDGTKMHSIIFPGLPIPVEVSYALVGDWLVAGLTPQSALTAARQISRPAGSGLMGNASFAEAMPKDTDVTSFSFIDTPRLMRDGYQYVSLIGSGIANMVRSSTNEAREPGLIVPTYADLRAGAKPMVSFTYWRGDDQISESRADRSMLVNAAGIAGAASPFIPLIAAAIAAGAPDHSTPFPPMHQVEEIPPVPDGE